MIEYPYLDTIRITWGYKPVFIWPLKAGHIEPQILKFVNPEKIHKFVSRLFVKFILLVWKTSENFKKLVKWWKINGNNEKLME